LKPIARLISDRSKFTRSPDATYSTFEIYNAAWLDNTPPAQRHLRDHLLDLFCKSGYGQLATARSDRSVHVPQARNSFASQLSRIVLVRNPLLEMAFTAGLNLTERQRTTGTAPGMHNPANPDEFEGEKEAVRSVLKSKMKYGELVGLEKANIIPTFHGCSHEAAAAICGSGMKNGVNAVQNGMFFGSGLYTTTTAEYGCLYARTVADGGVVSEESPRPANPKGEHVVLMQLANIGRAYVGTRIRDYPKNGNVISERNPDHRSFLHSESHLQRAAAVDQGVLPANYFEDVTAGYDSRYFICNEVVGYQAVNLLGPTGKRSDPTLPAAYDELILKESNQLCPVALFYIKSPPAGAAAGSS